MRTLQSLISMSIFAVATTVGCGEKEPGGNPLFEPKKSNSILLPAEQELGAKLSHIINTANAKYRNLKYEYDENLLDILDRIELRLAGNSDKLDPLPLPNLDEGEQIEHFRETTRRWTEKSKKDLRATIELLKASVAARKPGGPAYHPDFHKSFAAAFDDLIPLEVEEIRERRNKAIHSAAKPVFDEYRKSAPDAVKQHQKTLNTPPFHLPAKDTTTITN